MADAAWPQQQLDGMGSAPLCIPEWRDLPVWFFCLKDYSSHARREYLWWSWQVSRGCTKSDSLGYEVLLSCPNPSHDGQQELSCSPVGTVRVGRRHSQSCAQDLLSLPCAGHKAFELEEERQNTGFFPRGIFGRNGLFE